MGGPAGGGIEGPAGAGGGAPGGDPGGGGGGSDGGGPALRGPEGPGTGGSDASGPGPGDAPRAAREARPERGAPSEGKSDGGDRADRPDRGARKAVEDAGDGARKTRKSTEDAGSDKTRKAAEKATPGKEDSDRARTKDAAERKDAVDQKATDKAKEAQGKAADTPRTDTAGSAKPEGAKQVQLSGEKRDRVQTALRDKPDVKHRTHVDIDISIGRRLPRDWDFAPLPIVVIEIVPEYRDYVYVWVEDEYVICDPVTYEVVAVIPAGGGRRAAATYGQGGPDKCSTRIELSASERELILESVHSGREVDVSDLEIGWSVPSEIALERFPEQVLAEAEELSACRYFVADDQLAIVDPDEDKVVLLIDKS
jgi:hypothetical protein